MDLKRFNRGYCKTAGHLKNCLKRKCNNEGITTLSNSCHKGKKRINKITGDRKFCARMASLGVYPGEEVEVICAESGSQCLLRVHGGTVSFDSTTSDQILIESI